MIKQHEFCYPQNENSERGSSAEYKDARTFLAVL